MKNHVYFGCRVPKSHDTGDRPHGSGREVLKSNFRIKWINYTMATASISEPNVNSREKCEKSKNDKIRRKKNRPHQSTTMSKH